MHKEEDIFMWYESFNAGSEIYFLLWQFYQYTTVVKYALKQGKLYWFYLLDLTTI